jgi:hypothetical protein
MLDSTRSLLDYARWMLDAANIDDCYMAAKWLFDAARWMLDEC